MVKSITVDIEERAQIALQTSPIFDLRKLRVEIEDDALIITGKVATFYYKQMAQEAVRAVVRDIHVINRIDVD